MIAKPGKVSSVKPCMNENEIVICSQVSKATQEEATAAPLRLPPPRARAVPPAAQAEGARAAGEAAIRGEGDQGAARRPPRHVHQLRLQEGPVSE